MAIDMKREGRRTYYYCHGHDVLERICKGQDAEKIMQEIAKRALDGTFGHDKKQIPLVYYCVSEVYGEPDAIKYARRCGAAI